MNAPRTPAPRTPAPRTPGRLPRRAALAWAGGAAGVLAALALPGCAGAAAPRYTIGPRAIEHALAARFPRRYPLGGWADVELREPRVALLPERDQLNAVLDVQAGGPLLQGRQPRGVLDVDFGLRYEPSDRTVRADRPRVNLLRIEGLPPATAELLARWGAPLAEQALQGAVLHQLKDSDLALADTLGVQPERISVTSAGIVVQFGARRPAP